MECSTHPYPGNAGYKREISAVLDRHFCHGMRGFDRTGPVFNLGRAFASLTRNIMMQNLIYTSTCEAAVYIKNKKVPEVSV